MGSVRHYPDSFFDNRYHASLAVMIDDGSLQQEGGAATKKGPADRLRTGWAG
jgi:hypothetical protein